METFKLNRQQPGSAILGYTKPWPLTAKLMRQFIKIIIICNAVLLMQSCRKDVPKGQLITANGIVMDFAQQKPLPNVTIYLFGGHFYGFPRRIGYDSIPLDSVLSDANGSFSLRYSAEGKSDDYALSVIKNYLQPSNTENILPDASQQRYQFNFAYNLNNITISARQLHSLNVTLQVLSNPYDTLLFRVYNASSGQGIAQYQFFGRSIDTLLNTRYLPLSDNVFEYSVRTLSLIDSASYYIRITTDTMNLGNVDSIFISKKFNSTYDIPLKQY